MAPKKVGRPPKKDLKYYKFLIENNLANLDIYKPEYDQVIGVYATMLYEYDVVSKTYQISNFTDAEARLTLEKLRKDIKNYSDILMLNPKIYQNVLKHNKPETKNKLELLQIRKS